MPGRFAHGTFSIRRVAYYLYLTDAGIFGTSLGVSASFVYLFILFGAILNKTGAGKFFIDFTTALTGYTRGGPAKAPAMKVGLESTKLAIPGYMLPFMFIYHPELISWNFTSDLSLIKLGFFLLLATAMSIGISGGMQGYLIRETKFYERMMLLIGSLMIIPASYIINLMGLVLIGAALLSQKLFKEEKAPVLAE